MCAHNNTIYSSMLMCVMRVLTCIYLHAYTHFIMCVCVCACKYRWDKSSKFSNKKGCVFRNVNPLILYPSNKIDSCLIFLIIVTVLINAYYFIIIIIRVHRFISSMWLGNYKKNYYLKRYHDDAATFVTNQTRGGLIIQGSINDMYL